MRRCSWPAPLCTFSLENPQYSDCFANLSDDQIRGLGTTGCHCVKYLPAPDRLCTVDPSDAKEDIRQQMEVHMPVINPRSPRNCKTVAGPSLQTAFWEPKTKKPYDLVPFGPNPKPTNEAIKIGSTKESAVVVSGEAPPMAKSADWRFKPGLYIDSQAVVAALQRHGMVVVDSVAVDRNFLNPRLLFSKELRGANQVALVLRAGPHFIGGVAYKDQAREQMLFLLWDSGRGDKVGSGLGAPSEGNFAIARATQLLHKFLAAAWKIQVAEVFWMTCRRQEVGSNDCGIHTVNNILQHTRRTPVKLYDRRRLGDTFLNEPPPDTEKALRHLTEDRYKEWEKRAIFKSRLKTHIIDDTSHVEE